jgi:hypothetical protein
VLLCSLKSFCALLWSPTDERDIYVVPLYFIGKCALFSLYLSLDSARAHQVVLFNASSSMIDLGSCCLEG